MLIISLFTAQHVSNVSTSIFRSLRLIVDLFHVLYCFGSMCVDVTLWFGWGGVVSLCRLKHSFSLHKYGLLLLLLLLLCLWFIIIIIIIKDINLKNAKVVRSLVACHTYCVYDILSFLFDTVSRRHLPERWTDAYFSIEKIFCRFK